MSSQLLIQAEPFEGYSDTSAETEQGEYRGRTRGGNFKAGPVQRPARSSPSQSRSPQTSSSKGSALARRRRDGLRGPRWSTASAYGVAVPFAGAEWVTWVQQCLRNLIGPWVPQSGRMSRATRRAIRMFQKRQGIGVTGLLDGPTEAALQAACSGNAVSQATLPAPEPPESASASGTTDADGNEPASEPPDSPPGDSDDETLFGERESEAEREFQVTGNCQVRIQRHGPVPVSDSLNLPRAPGVYIIYVDRKVWYVGVTLRTLHERFQDRMKAFRDFNLPSSLLANRTISWVAIRSARLPACSIGRREQTKTAEPYTPVQGAAAVLKVLEQYYIQTLRPAGNRRTECVRFGPGGSIAILEDKQPPLVLDASSMIFRTKKCEPF